MSGEIELQRGAENFVDAAEAMFPVVGQVVQPGRNFAPLLSNILLTPFDREMRSELAVPLIGAGGTLEGVLNIESPQPDAFRDDDRHLLEALAAQAVIAIQEMRLLDTMQEIVEVLLTARVDDLLKLIIQRACDLINMEAGNFWMVCEPDTLVLRQSTEDQRLGEELSLSRSLTGQAIRLRQPITVDDVRTCPDFLKQQLAARKGWISAIFAFTPISCATSPTGIRSYCPAWLITLP